MSEELTAICSSCDCPIELEDNDPIVGDVVSCSNPGCFWEGVINEISDGNVWFEPDKEGE